MVARRGAGTTLDRTQHRKEIYSGAYLREMSFAHMARRVTEAKSAGVKKRIVDHVNRRRRYSPPKGLKL